MAVEMFSCSSLHERMCRTWGSNSGPLACQANTLPIEPPRPKEVQDDVVRLMTLTLRMDWPVGKLILVVDI